MIYGDTLVKFVIQLFQTLEATSHISADEFYEDNKKTHFVYSGPNQTTVNDMWRMVWQERVGKIIMLTNLVENGKVTTFVIRHNLVTSLN